ncbi:hypothetical protein [Roseateles sp. PN1]|uniref:hypothetical protein n=1 Tax=Roseateles sp. PN1 TaxID=3137372 RepID=UPI00313A113B
MRTIAMSIFLDSEFGADTELPKAGGSLEHPLVFDSAARDFHALALQGRVEILQAHMIYVGGEPMIDSLRFRRLN